MKHESQVNDAVVRALLAAHAGGPAADDQVFRDRVVSAEQAYAIQEAFHAALPNPGGVPRYWKSGGASRMDTMRHASLPAAGVRASGDGMDGLHLRHRWIEAEVALRLGRDVTPADASGVAPDTAGDLVDGMCVSIEVVDTRWAGGRGTPALLKLADLVVNGALVLGEFVPFAARAWAWQECRVCIGGGAWKTFVGSLGVGDPAFVLPAWLRHVTRTGATVPAGTVVSTGSWCGLLDAAGGDEVRAGFRGIGETVLQL